MSRRKIVHVDMDCFYAAVEVRDRPDLKGKPVVVGGRPDGRGVIAAASYEARRFGVRSAMSSAKALRLCPDLVFVGAHFHKYRKESRHIREIFSRFTHLIEPLSLDEAYLDVTEADFFDNSATKIAREIRRLIYQETGLSASAGIAENKFLAKIASDWKKPNGQFTILPGQVMDFLQDLPVGKIHGVGKVTEAKMQKLGLKTCGDIRYLSREQLQSWFGSWGSVLFDLVRGIDNREVKASRERKSLSVERTLSSSLEGLDSAKCEIEKVFSEFQSRVEAAALNGESFKSIFVKLKFDDFSQVTRETGWLKHGQPGIDDFLPLFEDAWAGQVQKARLIGLGIRLKSRQNPSQKGPQLRLF